MSVIACAVTDPPLTNTLVLTLRLAPPISLLAITAAPAIELEPVPEPAIARISASSMPVSVTTPSGALTVALAMWTSIERNLIELSATAPAAATPSEPEPAAVIESIRGFDVAAASRCQRRSRWFRRRSRRG